MERSMGCDRPQTPLVRRSVFHLVRRLPTHADSLLRHDSSDSRLKRHRGYHLNLPEPPIENSISLCYCLVETRRPLAAPVADSWMPTIHYPSYFSWSLLLPLDRTNKPESAILTYPPCNGCILWVTCSGLFSSLALLLLLGRTQIIPREHVSFAL